MLELGTNDQNYYFTTSKVLDMSFVYVCQLTVSELFSTGHLTQVPKSVNRSEFYSIQQRNRNVFVLN